MKQKKFLAVIVAVLILTSAFSVTVFAGDGDDYGSAPKTNAAITMDGEKDEIYNLGLTIDINRNDNDIGTNGKATVLWADGFLYVFGEISDSAMIPPDPDKQEGSPWSCDSLEVFIDENNTGDTAGNVMQYRIDITGWPCVYNQGGLADYGPNVGNQFEHAYKVVAGGYNTEFKIPIKISEGAKLGIQFQINDVQDEDGTQQIVLSKNDKGESASWAGDLYGFLTLGSLVSLPEPEPEPEPDLPEAAGGGSSAPEQPVVTAPVTTAPKTGDAGMIIIITAFIAGAAVLVFKTKKDRA